VVGHGAVVGDYLCGVEVQRLGQIEGKAFASEEKGHSNFVQAFLKRTVRGVYIE